jgi:hypothetical protein
MCYARISKRQVETLSVVESVSTTALSQWIADAGL